MGSCCGASNMTGYTSSQCMYSRRTNNSRYMLMNLPQSFRLHNILIKYSNLQRLMNLVGVKICGGGCRVRGLMGAREKHTDTRVFMVENIHIFLLYCSSLNLHLPDSNAQRCFSDGVLPDQRVQQKLYSRIIVHSLSTVKFGLIVGGISIYQMVNAQTMDGTVCDYGAVLQQKRRVLCESKLSL